MMRTRGQRKRDQESRAQVQVVRVDDGRYGYSLDEPHESISSHTRTRGQIKRTQAKKTNGPMRAIIVIALGLAVVLL